MKLAEARPGHHQHAEHADRDRRPAARPDPFAKRRPGQRRDHEGRGKGNREDLVEPQIAQRKEVEHGRAEQQRRPADLQDRPSGAQEAGPAQWIRDDEGEQEGKGVSRPHDLHHRDLASEIFRRGIEAGESGDRPADQRNADQARAAGGGRVAGGGIGYHVDGGARGALRRRAEHAADGGGRRQNSKNGAQVIGEMRWGVMREWRG